MRKNFASRAMGLLPFFLVLGPSCSLVYDLSPDQCGTNDDCAHFGPGMVCNTGICACGNKALCGAGGSGATGGTGGDGGTLFGGTGGTDGGTGGTLTGGTGGDAGSPPEVGGSSAVGGSGGSTGGKGGSGGKGGKGGASGTGNTGNEAGAAGMTQGPECVTHKDCFTLYPDDSSANPRACVDGTCVPLKSPDCPVVLPTYDNGQWNALTSTDAIILGGFAPLNGLSLDVIGRNYDLALDELSHTTGGVWSGTTRRHELVMVVCYDFYDTQAQLLPPAQHLINELQVPGIVAALRLQDQRYVWDNVARDAGTFMMMSLYSDNALMNEPDSGLIWNMLSGADALSVTYQPLIDMTIDHLRLNGVLGSTDPVKIAHIEATDEPFLADTANYIEANVQFNGQSVADNLSAGDYDAVSVLSSYADPTDQQGTQATAATEILSFKPQIVLGTSVADLVTTILPYVENNWDDSTPRPFYILDALEGSENELKAFMQADHSASHSATPLYKRVLGLNWPSAADQTLNNLYQARYKKKYVTAAPGYENYYDSAYYLMYGVAAARLPLTGVGITKGLLRVTSLLSGTPVVDVGPGTDMDTYITQLNMSASSKIELVGAMGPPAWDDVGTRQDPGSVWCVNPGGTYYFDQLRYDAGPPAKLTGKIDPVNCFTFDGMQ